MSFLGHVRLAAQNEDGGILVIFALFAPVIILLASFAIDVGNSLLHARHLQVQADAGALAAAQEFQPCISQNINRVAAQYSGVEHATAPGEAGIVAAGPLLNEQVQTGKRTKTEQQAQLHELINSKRYFGQSAPVDATAEEKSPCEAEMVDVKVTETKLPWYFKLARQVLTGVPYNNAHARVEVLQETKASKVQPLAVAESAPVAVRAYFVDEAASNKELANVALTTAGTNEKGQEIWTSASAPLALAINKPHIGVVVALSGNKADTKCGDAYVKCFDQGSSGPLLHVAGYSLGGTGTLIAPLARAVTLSSPVPNTCADAYFSSAVGSCSFTISAKVDYGSASTAGISVFPEVGGTKGAAMTFNAGTGSWTGVATHTATAGSNEVNLVVECNNKASGSLCASEKKALKATIKDVHRSYTASESGSGTIAGAWLSEVGGLPQDANSFEVCEAQDGNSCTHKLVLTLNIGASLANAQKYTDPLYHMRFGSSQAEVVGCGPGKEASGAEYREHLAKGCEGKFVINTSDPNCTGTSEPYDCIGFASGVKTGPFAQGLAKRFETEPPQGTRFYCANNWVKNNGEAVPLLPKDDSRIIQLFIEPYGADGSKSAPIQDFATFYVTGWDGDGCNGQKPKPSHLDDEAGKGEVVGHFVKYVNTLNAEDGGGQKCAVNSLGECVTVLTR